MGKSVYCCKESGCKCQRLYHFPLDKLYLTFLSMFHAHGMQQSESGMPGKCHDKKDKHLNMLKKMEDDLIHNTSTDSSLLEMAWSTEKTNGLKCINWKTQAKLKMFIWLRVKKFAYTCDHS